MHALAVKLLGLVQLQSEIDQAQRWNHTQAQSHTPDGTQMVLGKNQAENHGDEGRENVAGVNQKIGEHDKPAVPMAFFQLAGVLGARDRPRGILASDADADEEPIGREGSKQAILAVAVTVGTRAESRKDEQDQGGDHERPLTRPVITGVAEDQHPDNSPSKGN